MKLILVRGLPGSGKSSYIVTQLLHDDWYEADMFFMQNNIYNWNPKLLSEAHDWCYLNTLKSLLSNNTCYVSNTFTTPQEMERYLHLVDLIPDLEIHVVEMLTQYDPIHEVPKATIAMMKTRWIPTIQFPNNLYNNIHKLTIIQK